MTAAKKSKVVSLTPKEKPPEPQPEPTEEESFLDRGPEICAHLATWGTGKVNDVDDLYEVTTLLIKQIMALFSAMYELKGGSGDEDKLSLCLLGEDLAREALRRV